MFQREGIDDGFSGSVPDGGAQFGIWEQGLKSLDQFFQTVHGNKPPVGAVLDNFINSLPAACDHGLAAGHGFEVNASQTLVSAGQHKY
jgi:hypothetical protein